MQEATAAMPTGAAYRLELSYEPMQRYNALAKTLSSPRGWKSPEHLEVLRQSNPCYGSLLPEQDRPSVHELSYDPMARYNALAKTLRRPRGWKSPEHLEVLRQSNPCYGSLAPLQDHAAVHEVSYDPMARYNAVARSLRRARGWKSALHLEALRQSNPCWGSMGPRLDRPRAHELSYDPLARFSTLASSLRQPRGFKSTREHKLLRVNNPCWGSLAPRADRPAKHELTYDPVARYMALAPTMRRPRGWKSPEHLETLRRSNPCGRIRLSDLSDLPSLASMSYADEGWKQSITLDRQIRSVSSIQARLDEAGDEPSDLDVIREQILARRPQPVLHQSLDSDWSAEYDDLDSECSARRTVCREQRSSNDTVASFLEEEGFGKGGYTSGEWSVPDSPLLGSEKGKPIKVAPDFSLPAQAIPQIAKKKAPVTNPLPSHAARWPHRST